MCSDQIVARQPTFLVALNLLVILASMCMCAMAVADWMGGGPARYPHEHEDRVLSSLTPGLIGGSAICANRATVSSPAAKWKSLSRVLLALSLISLVVQVYWQPW
jgi:hypothetical protein